MNEISLMRWGTRALLASALLLAVCAALVWVAQRPQFDLQRIEVNGSLRHVSRTAIRAAIAGRLQGTFFTMSLAQTRAAFESIPWVAAASVRRVWPDRLVVTLVERHAVGLWNDGRVVADDGALFDVNPAEAELDGPLVDFSGPPQMAGEAVARLHSFDALLASLPASVAAIDISERASWTIRTNGGQTLELGRDVPLGSVPARLAAIVTNYPTVVAQLSGNPARIDARYNNGFAATRP